MTYLAFLLATGLYWGLGPGGPLHKDNGVVALRRRVDAIEPDFWVGFALLVVVPCALLALIYAFFESLFGGAAMLIIGTASLFFAFGRADYDSLHGRFMSRSQAGDYEGAALLLEEAGAAIDADSADEFGQRAAKAFAYEGYQRWFAPAFYFLLLGPFWAVAYRLIQLNADDRTVPIGSLRHLADWLPSRVLLLTLVVVGETRETLAVLADRAIDPSVDTDTLLLEGIEADGSNADTQPEQRVEQVYTLLRRAALVWLVVASIVAIV